MANTSRRTRTIRHSTAGTGSGMRRAVFSPLDVRLREAAAFRSGSFCYTSSTSGGDVSAPMRSVDAAPTCQAGCERRADGGKVVARERFRPRLTLADDLIAYVAILARERRRSGYA